MSRMPTLPLCLHGGHYFAMRRNRKNQPWPKEWAVTAEETKEEETPYSDVFRGGGTSEEALAPCAPIKVNKSTQEDELDFLRTCSSARTDLLRTCSNLTGSD